jgi:hypothetical protein
MLFFALFNAKINTTQQKMRCVVFWIIINNLVVR